MNTTEFRAKARQIMDSLDRSTASWWEGALGSGRAGRVVREVLDRVVLLVGDQKAELVDGQLTDDDGASGSLLVATRERLIRAAFETTRDENHQLTTTLRVEAVPLTAVRTVRSELVGTSAEGDEPWPLRARITLVLDRELAGATEIAIPATIPAEREHAAAITALAQRLPLA